MLSQEIFAQTKTVSLTVLRQQGLIGRVSVSYETVQAQSVAHANEKIAQPGVDYVSKKGLVGIAEGENSTTITVDILHVSLLIAERHEQANTTANRKIKHNIFKNRQ